MLRPAGFLLAALLATTASAQVPGVAPVPGQPPAGPPAAQPAADPKLDPHLDAWERRMTGVQSFHAKIGLTRKDAVFQKPLKYAGSVLCMKPNFAILRLESTVPRQPNQPHDYEAFICTGAAVYEYSGRRQEVTEYPINPGQAGDNLMLDFLSGMKAADAKRRFQMSLFNQDNTYVYIDIKPLAQKDRAEFEQIRFAMFGPRLEQFAYLPAQVWLQKPNGDTELWEFSEPQTNVQGVDPKAVFKYTPVKERDKNGKEWEWPLKRANAGPPPVGAPPKAGPGVGNGGAIRP